MTVVYATSQEYADYTQTTPPANIAVLLRSASRLVADEIRTVLYVVDDDGAPTDADVAEALLEATCTQAAAWVALGIDPLSGGAVTSTVVSSKSLDGASIAYADASDAAAARTAATDCLVPEAWRILNQADLTSTRVWTRG